MADAKQRNRVDTVHPQIKEDQDRHELARALREGVIAMRDLARQWKYMKPNPGELEQVPLGVGTDGGTVNYAGAKGVTRTGSAFTVYDLRIDRTCMLNPWADSIRDTARLPFRSRIQLQGWDEELSGVDQFDDKGAMIGHKPGWVDNIDGEGRSLDEWAADVFEDALFEGVVFGFVDNDPRVFKDPESRRLAGGRPYVTKINRGSVRRITIQRTLAGPPRVKQIAFDQPIPEIDIEDPDNWTDETTPAIKIVTAGERLYDDNGRPVGSTPVRVACYVENAEGQMVRDHERDGTIEPENPLDKMPDIPLVPFYGRRTGPYRGECPYLGTADIQATIWNQMSELLNKAREASISYVHETGVGGEDGGDAQPVNRDTLNFRYRWSTHPTAKLSVVEQSGDALERLQKLVEWLCSWVEEAHHQISSDKPSAPVTAREITLEGVHASSALEMMVIFQEHGWKAMLDILALLGGLSKRGMVSIPHDFGLPNSGMNRLHALFLAGRMTAKNYWSEARRAGDVHEREFDIDAEIELEKAAAELEARTAARELQAQLGEDDPGVDPDEVDGATATSEG